MLLNKQEVNKNQNEKKNTSRTENEIKTYKILLVITKKCLRGTFIVINVTSRNNKKTNFILQRTRKSRIN